MAVFKPEDAPNYERMYWEKALKSFKQGRMQGKKDKDDEKKLDDFLKDYSTPQETKEVCKSVQEAADDEYSPSIGGILEKIEFAMSIGDVAIKSAPESVGLAWMGIRLCLRSVADDFTTFRIFGSACSDILGILISCAVFSRMYGPSRGIEAFEEIHTQVTDRIPIIYAEILDFSFSVKKHRSRSKGGRFVRGLVNYHQASEKYGAKIKSIKDHDMAMAEFARRAHEQLADYYLRTGQETQKEVLSGLNDIRTKVDQLKQTHSHQVQVLVEELSKRKEMTPHDVAVKNFDDNMKELLATSDQKGIYNAKLARRSPPQTCTWIFDQEAFKAWYDSDKSNMLWVSGGGGFGKSILMAAVVSELQTRATDQDAIIQYFFCNDGDDATKRTERILKHILSQVYQRVSEQPTETIETSNKLVSAYLKGAKGTKGTKTGQSDKKEDVSFGDAFRGIVRLLGKSAYVMVDALDECSDRSKGLLSSLRELVEDPQPVIKVILCSRPDPDIETGLDQIPMIKVEGNNGPDIKLNAETELSKLPGWSANERDLATQRIVEKAGSYFRYVDLAISFLKQPWQRPLRTHLEQLPEGLPAFYEQIIKKTDPAYLDLLKTCLTWTILADGKVHVSEIIDVYSRVYAIEDEDAQQFQEEDDFNDDSELTTDRQRDPGGLYITQIRTAGSSLLEVDTESHVIQLRHNTVADHFLNVKSPTAVPEEVKSSLSHCEGCSKAENPTNRFSVSEKQGHLSIATTILKHLMNENFRKRYLLPYERTKLKGVYAERPHGFKTEEKVEEPQKDDQDSANAEKLQDVTIEKEADVSPEEAEHDSENGDNAKDLLKEDTDIIQSPEVGVKSNPVANKTTENTSVDNVESDLEGNISTKDLPKEEAAGNDSNDKQDTKGTQNVSEDAAKDNAEGDADSDVASEADSDAVLDDAAQTYDINVEDDRTRLYRYEVTYCAYHLRRVEELFEPSDRTGPEWEEFDALRIAFFRDTSNSFRSWVNLINQVRNGMLSWVDDVQTIHPTHVAASYGLTSLMRKLIADGADLAQLTDEGYTPLDYAIEYYNGVKVDDEKWYNNSLSLFRTLLESKADVNAIPVRTRVSSFYRLFWYNPSLEMVQLFLQHGADIFQRGSYWKASILHVFCASCDQADVLKELLERGAELEALDSVKETPLHWLMSRFQNEGVPEDIIKILIDAGVNVNAEDEASMRPLREICRFNGSVKAAELLIDAGADIHDDDITRQTALHTAAEFGFAEVVKLLIDKGARMGVQDEKGCTPLYKACGAKTDDCALYMIPHAEDIIDQPANNGKTPLRKAAARGHRKIVEAIFAKSDHNISVLTSKDAKKRTPLHAAAQHGRKDVVEYLLQQGVPAIVEDKKGQTPLRACFEGWSEARSKDYEAVCVLLLDAEKHIKPDAGLLHIAAARGSLPVLSKLMDKGADPLAQDEHGWTSIQIAQHYRHEDAAKALATRRVITGYRPSELKNTLPKLLELSDDKLEIKSASKASQISASAMAHHPIPAGTSSFYFEITIDTSSRVDSSTEEPSVALGLCHYPRKSLRSWFPGWATYPNWGSWAYHGDDGWLASSLSKDASLIARYGHGDTVGCGIDVHKETIFFTKNGELLEVERPSRSTYHAHTGVAGRLYPVVGLNTGGIKLSVNFGNDLVSKPFRWEPGNEADNGIAFVAEKEEMLARRPLRRRTTQNASITNVSEDATASAEAPSIARVSSATNLQSGANQLSA